ncbi:MAG: condensation domain-containing protein, partial [Cyclobacteriaceae bacterium]
EELDAENLRSYLLAYLPEYMVPQYYVWQESFRLTANGKIDRSALPLPELNTEEIYQAPASETEEQMVVLWSEVLKLPADQISVTQGFFALGGHSLRATILINRVNKELNVNADLQDIFTFQNIRKLSVYIEKIAGSGKSPISEASERSYYPLSSAQRRMFILHEFDRDSLAYNMPDAIRLKGYLSKERLENALIQLISRHQILRTSFGIEGDEAVQYVHDEVAYSIKYYAGEESSIAAFMDDFIIPFQLDKAPLLRMGLISLKHEEHILLFDIHHIIHDGLSQEILVREFMRLYNGEELHPVLLHYKDYAVWQQEEVQIEAIAEDKDYWLNVYSELPTPLDLPLDNRRPLLRKQEGDIYVFSLTNEEVTGLQKLSGRAGTTMYMTLLSIFGILLSRLSNQEDIVIGTPTSGRNHADLEEMLGMFVNTLALRIDVSLASDYIDYLQSVKAFVLDSFRHQGFQYEELIDALQLSRNTSRNPLFDVMFSYNHQEDTTAERTIGLKGLEASPYDRNTTIAKFDLTMNVTQTGDTIKVSFNYNKQLFEERSVARFSSYLRRIIVAVTSDPTLKLYELDILTSEEKNILQFDLNNTKAIYPSEATIVELFEKQVAATPDTIALEMASEQATYKELNEKANQLASHLRSLGVNQSTVVGLMLERSINMIVGILGILKSGGVYFPLDSSQPEKRVLHLLNESQAFLLLTETEQTSRYSDHIQVVDISNSEIFSGDKKNLPITISGLHPAYIIFTSGSTGNPKGVKINHHAVINLIFSVSETYQVSTDDKILQFANIVFDASVQQIWLALLNGARLILISKENILDRQTFLRYIEVHEVTHLHVTPSYLENIGTQ